jgi:hypothetical protein
MRRLALRAAVRWGVGVTPAPTRCGGGLVAATLPRALGSAAAMQLQPSASALVPGAQLAVSPQRLGAPATLPRVTRVTPTALAPVRHSSPPHPGFPSHRTTFLQPVGYSDTTRSPMRCALTLHWIPQRASFGEKQEPHDRHGHHTPPFITWVVAAPPLCLLVVLTGL